MENMTVSIKLRSIQQAVLLIDDIVHINIPPATANGTWVRSVRSAVLFSSSHTIRYLTQK